MIPGPGEVPGSPQSREWEDFPLHFRVLRDPACGRVDGAKSDQGKSPSLRYWIRASPIGVSSPSEIGRAPARVSGGPRSVLAGAQA